MIAVDFKTTAGTPVQTILQPVPFLRAEKPGVLYGFSGGQMRKCRKPDINSDSFFGWWKRGWGGNVARERRIPSRSLLSGWIQPVLEVLTSMIRMP